MFSVHVSGQPTPGGGGRWGLEEMLSESLVNYSMLSTHWGPPSSLSKRALRRIPCVAIYQEELQLHMRSREEGAQGGHLALSLLGTCGSVCPAQTKGRHAGLAALGRESPQ